MLALQLAALLLSAAPLQDAESPRETAFYRVARVELLMDGGLRVEFASDPREEAVAIEAGAQASARLREALSARLPASDLETSVTVRAAPQVRFERVREVLQACSTAGAGIANVAFESGDTDAPELFRTRDLLTSSKALLAQGVAHAVLDVRIQEEGTKVEPDTGAPWTGTGPYRYEGRVVVFAYNKAFDTEGGASAMAGYATSVQDLDMTLSMLKKRGTAELLIRPDAHVEMGDLDGLLELTRSQGLEPRFDDGSGGEQGEDD